MPNNYGGMTEAAFLKQVCAVAKLRGWLIYHAKPAQVGERWATHFQGDAGFPDLVLSHPLGVTNSPTHSCAGKDTCSRQTTSVTAGTQKT